MWRNGIYYCLSPRCDSFGDFVNYYQLLPLIIGAIIIIAICAIAVLVFDVGKKKPPKTAEELAQESVWLQAETRKLDAQIEHEMKQAELRDLRRFINDRNKSGGAHA